MTTRTIHIEGIGAMKDSEALAKLSEYEGQIDGLEATIEGHLAGVKECRRQVTEIEKLAEPIRKALLERLGAER